MCKNFERLKKLFNYKYISDEEFIEIIDRLLSRYARSAEKYNGKIIRNITFFKARYISGRTAADIAAEYNTSSTAVEQISNKVCWYIYNLDLGKYYRNKPDEGIIHIEELDPDRIDRSEFDTRTYNVLIRAGYTKKSEVKEVLKNDPDKIKGLRNLGTKSFEALCNKLKEA